jgi:prepilin-type N-terminal cleavage/methylation domain-containing protein
VKRPGFTLIEMLVALALSGLFMVMVFQSLGAFWRYSNQLLTAGENQQIVDLVISRIGSDVRQANSILLDSNEHQLCLISNDVQLDYTLTSGKIRRRVNGRTEYLTDLDEIKNLSFAYPAAGLVTVAVDQTATGFALRNGL